MDNHDIAAFVGQLHDAGQFAGPGTQEAAATPTLLRHRHDRDVEQWVAAVVGALRDGMREDHQPPVARAVLQTPGAAIASEAEPCCHTGWFVDELRRRAASLPDVWVALAVPDTSHHVAVAEWNPTNTGYDVTVRHMRWFVEVRGRRMGLRDGKLLRTGCTALDRSAVDLAAVNDDVADDPAVRRLGRRILHGHPVRRC